MAHRRIPLVLASALACAAALVSASTPSFWQVSTRADLLKGDVENLSIDNDGRITLGPPTALVYDSAAPFLWTVLPLPGGDYLVGSGNEGKVFRVEPHRFLANGVAQSGGLACQVDRSGCELRGTR